MSICRKCSKKIDADAIFCPYCGEVVVKEQESNSTIDDSVEKTCTRKKVITKKRIILVSVVVVVAILIGTVISWEVKIANAKKLYAQGKYTRAYLQICNVPSLGREEVIRFKVLDLAAGGYDDYLTTKRIRISSTDRVHDDAYRDAFGDLMWGLLININRSQDEGLNAIEIDEYQKFRDIYYDELQSMFAMSRAEADMLIEKLNNTKDSSERKDIANRWLDEHFFD